jgi:catechol 2,3-dioxygenase
MKIKSLGHVVLHVSSCERAEKFYNGVLGLAVCARLRDKGAPKMTFFSLGNHHDFAVMEVGEGRVNSATSGLAHVAFNVGTTDDELRAARDKLAAAGIASVPIDHEVSHSLYFSDPDGNGIELYVDASDSWRRDPQRVAQIKPLAL